MKQEKIIRRKKRRKRSRAEMKSRTACEEATQEKENLLSFPSSPLYEYNVIVFSSEPRQKTLPFDSDYASLPSLSPESSLARRPAVDGSPPADESGNTPSCFTSECFVPF